MLRTARRYVTFLGGSVLGAAVDYVFTLTGVAVLHLSAEAALGVSMILSATAVFFWHDIVTFRGNNATGRTRRYVGFMAWSGVVFALRAGILTVLRGWIGLSLPVALALAIIFASLISFAVSASVIFRSRRP